MSNPISRPDFFTRHDGGKAQLPFSTNEYERRLSKLRAIMQEKDIDCVILTSMHNIAYYSGFLYCAFGRPYGCVVTQTTCTTISANIDASQPWRRSHCENIIYTDWRRDNYWRAIMQASGAVKRLGIEGDHLTLAAQDKLNAMMNSPTLIDIAPDTMQARMIKSAEEIVLIKEGARVADLGGEAIHAAICEGEREIDVAMSGRDAMELEIARAFPDSELRDSWVWFQSGINTDGAHNPVTCRKLEQGDILSLNTFPMISS